MTVLLNAAGTPEPSPTVQQRLAAIQPGLHLRYIEGVSGVWAICLTWRHGDPRYERIQTGQLAITEAFDILGYLPMDCPPDAAGGYVERTLRTYPKEDVQRMADAVSLWNATQPAKAAAEQALAEVLDAPDPSQTTRVKGRRTRIPLTLPT